MKTIKYKLIFLILTLHLLIGCDTTVMAPIQPGNMGISFDLFEPATVTLTIENCYNTVIKTLLDHESLPGGTYEINWNGRDDREAEIVEGIYFFHLIIENSKGKSEEVVKVILVNS